MSDYPYKKMKTTKLPPGYHTYSVCFSHLSTIKACQL